MPHALFRHALHLTKSFFERKTAPKEKLVSLFQGAPGFN
jgi:hypothetical protein